MKWVFLILVVSLLLGIVVVTIGPYPASCDFQKVGSQYKKECNTCTCEWLGPSCTEMSCVYQQKLELPRGYKTLSLSASKLILTEQRDSVNIEVGIKNHLYDEPLPYSIQIHPIRSKLDQSPNNAFLIEDLPPAGLLNPNAQLSHNITVKRLPTALPDTYILEAQVRDQEDLIYAKKSFFIEIK